MNIEKWMSSGEYLPPVLRDFHDQKDIFKAMHETITGHDVINGNGVVTPVNWISGQIYVIDVFLWFMARRGYTLQRSRAKVEFRNLAADVKAKEDARNSAFYAALKGEKKGGDQ